MKRQISVLLFLSSPWITLAILSSLGMIAMFAETMILPAIPDFVEDFDISYDSSSWILAIFLVTGAVMTPIAGKLADVYGKKKMLLVILGTYGIGILLGALSTNFPFMVVARAIQGVGISIFPIAFSIIRDKFLPEKLALAQGIFSSMLSAGAVIGLVVGASVIENFGWRATFLLVLPVVIILFALIKKYITLKEDETLHTVSDKSSEFCCRFIHVRKDILLSENRVHENGKLENHYLNDDKKERLSLRSIDLKGALALSVTVVSFLILLQFMEKGSTPSTYLIQIVTFSSISILSLIFFVIVEKSTPMPLIDFKLLTNRVILSANIVNMVVGVTALMVVYQSIPILVRTPPPVGFAGDALTVAHIQLPYMIVSLVFSIASGFIISKIGNLRPTVIGTLVTTIGFLTLFLLHSSEIAIMLILVIVAIGLAFMQVGSMNVVLVSTPKQFSGISLGMTLLIYLIGASVGPVIAGIYMDADQVVLQAGDFVSSFPSDEAYNLILMTATLISAGSIAFALFMYKSVKSKNRMLIN
ncbi:MAG TPA: MFS transporter [Nitrososphaeraceae archaeon]|jgi:MFS family permease|nr:MFS transporter [Nitrososphaeraceae archaeon]